MTSRRKVRLVPTHQVEPPHELQDLAVFARLVDGMSRRGWRGRPLLVEEVEGGWLAWTGTHRLYAALASGVWRVPVVEVDKRRWKKAHGPPPSGTAMLSETFEDECRLGWLLMTGDEPAIELMRYEVLYGGR